MDQQQYDSSGIEVEVTIEDYDAIGPFNSAMRAHILT